MKHMSRVLLCLVLLTGMLSTTMAKQGKVRLVKKGAHYKVAVVKKGDDVKIVKVQNFITKKVDNFVFVIDQSGSMADSYAGQDAKINMAKSAAAAITAMIPAELQYNSMLVTGAGYNVVSPVGPFMPASYSQAIGSVPTEIGGTWGNPTNIGRAIELLGPTLKSLKGSTAVVLFTDGGNNKGISIQNAADYAAMKYNATFHVVNYGHAKISQTVAGLNRGSVAISGTDVMDPAKRLEFVNEVFLTHQKGIADRVVTHTLRILFDTAKAVIKPKYRKDVAALAEFIKKNPTMPLTIEGHTDNVGSAEYNQGLSQRRAESVITYLKQQFGVDTSHLTAVGRGFTMPVASNSNAAGRQLNRRIESVLYR